MNLLGTLLVYNRSKQWAELLKNKSKYVYIDAAHGVTNCSIKIGQAV